MVLQVILRQKTTFSVKIFYLNRTEDIAHTIARAGDNTHVARSQSSQSRKLNFSYFTRSGLQLHKQEIWVRD